MGNGAPKTGGTGIKQLRENIAESKLSYEIMDDAAQAFLKSKIMDNIHKYFYLILYTAYIRQAGEAARNAVDEASKADVALSSGKCAIPADQLKVGKTFVQFMEENTGLRTLIEEGKGDLQWERDIPPAALANLEELAKGLQGEPGDNHPRHLPDRPPHVRRHASGGSQEASQVQVRFQDPDEAVAEGAVEPGGGADREEDNHFGPL